MNQEALEAAARALLAYAVSSDARGGERAVGHSGPENNDWEEYTEIPNSFLVRLSEALP